MEFRSMNLYIDLAWQYCDILRLSTLSLCILNILENNSQV